MLLDAKAVFSPFSTMGGTPDSLANSIGTTYSSLTYDVSGAGLGNSPSIKTGVTPFGQDLGGQVSGIKKPVIEYFFPTLPVGASALLNIQLQSAPDNGSNQPGNWSVVNETGAVPVVSLVQKTHSLAIMPRQDGASLPRFYRLAYVISGAAITSGTISAGVSIGADTSSLIGDSGRNYNA
jgi:hypothetical protein